jgi:hypothetical protein
MRAFSAVTTIIDLSGANSSRARLAEDAWMAVAAVPDPEIGVSPGKLNMLRGVELEGSTARVRIALTVPGTGDVPISIGAMLPTAGVVVVTTPQDSVADVAERAGRMAQHAQLRVSGAIENMSAFVCPCCGEDDRDEMAAGTVAVVGVTRAVQHRLAGELPAPAPP